MTIEKVHRDLAPWQRRLLAASGHAASVAGELADTVSEGSLHKTDNIGSGDFLAHLVDAVRLMLEGVENYDADLPASASSNQALHDAICAWLEEEDRG